MFEIYDKSREQSGKRAYIFSCSEFVQQGGDNVKSALENWALKRLTSSFKKHEVEAALTNDLNEHV